MSLVHLHLAQRGFAARPCANRLPKPFAGQCARRVSTAVRGGRSLNRLRKLTGK